MVRNSSEPFGPIRLHQAYREYGSASPVLIGPDLLAQGGKDALMRLLSTAVIAGADPRTGNELQAVSTPSRGMMFTAPAVWRDRAETWMFAADSRRHCRVDQH